MEKIFKWFTVSGERLSLVRIAWFVDRFKHTEFLGVDKLLCLFLEYCANLDIPALRHYLEAFMVTEGKKCIKKHNIKLDTMAAFNYDEPASLEEAYRIISTSLFATYDSYCQQDLNDRSFKVDMVTFMETRKKEKLQEVLIKTFPRLSNGDDIDEAMSDVQYEVESIQSLYNTEYLDKLDFMAGSMAVSKGTFKQRLLFQTGMPCIDGDIGGTYSQMLWSFTGSPGSGKTRFSVAQFVYMAMRAGIDTLYHELELSCMELENMLVAHHIVYLYGGKIKIPDSDMNKDRLTPEQRRYYESAKMDLFESGKYGKCIIVTDDLIIEDMEKEVMKYLKHNRNIQFWVVDYAGLIKSAPKNRYDRAKDHTEIIDDAYRIGKSISKIADIGVLFLNQFNKEGIDAARMGKRIMPGHVQGGQSIARHADYDLVMCMTEEQELANMRTLSTVKKRAAKGFQNVPLSVDLAVSLFRQLKQSATN